MTRENIFREESGKTQIGQRAVKRRHTALVTVRRVRIEHARFQRLRGIRAEPRRITFKYQTGVETERRDYK